MRNNHWQIERDAGEYATEHMINEEKRAAFIAGAKWTIEKLLQLTEEHPMEEHGGAKKICNEIRLKEVNKFIKDMCSYVSKEDK